MIQRSKVKKSEISFPSAGVHVDLAILDLAALVSVAALYVSRYSLGESG
jgi:hypothetical protein